MTFGLAVLSGVLLIASFIGWVVAVEKFDLGGRTTVGGLVFLVLSGLVLLCIAVASAPASIHGDSGDQALWFFVGYSMGK